MRARLARSLSNPALSLCILRCRAPVDARTAPQRTLAIRFASEMGLASTLRLDCKVASAIVFLSTNEERGPQATTPLACRQVGMLAGPASTGRVDNKALRLTSGVTLRATSGGNKDSR